MRLLSDACGGDHQGDEPQVQKQQVQIPKVTIKALERKVDEPITLMQHRAVQFNEVHYDEEHFRLYDEGAAASVGHRSCRGK